MTMTIVNQLFGSPATTFGPGEKLTEIINVLIVAGMVPNTYRVEDRQVSTFRHGERVFYLQGVYANTEYFGCNVKEVDPKSPFNFAHFGGPFFPTKLFVRE